MEREEFLSDLTVQLQLRGLAEDKIKEIIQGIDTQLDEVGKPPTDAFGPPDTYAEEVVSLAERERIDQAEPGWHHRTFQATAFDEMEILWRAGKEGWELLDVGFYALFCRRAADPEQVNRWEYQRRTSTSHPEIAGEMAEDGWAPCGQWVFFHYFKRKIR